LRTEASVDCDRDWVGWDAAVVAALLGGAAAQGDLDLSDQVALVEVEAAKSTADVEAPTSGVLHKILAEADDRDAALVAPVVA